MYKLLFNSEPEDTGGGDQEQQKDYDKIWQEIPNDKKMVYASQFATNSGGKYFPTKNLFEEALQKEANQATYNTYDKSEKIIAETTGIPKKEGEELKDYAKRAYSEASKKEDINIEESPEYLAVKKKLEERDQAFTTLNEEVEAQKKQTQKQQREQIIDSGIPDLDYPDELKSTVSSGIKARVKENVDIRFEEGKPVVYRKNGEKFLDNVGNPLEPQKAILQAVSEMEGIKIKKVSSSLPTGNLNEKELGTLKNKAEEAANKAGVLPGSKEWLDIMDKHSVPVSKELREAIG